MLLKSPENGYSIWSLDSSFPHPPLCAKDELLKTLMHLFTGLFLSGYAMHFTHAQSKPEALRHMEEHSAQDGQGFGGSVP